MDIKICLKRSRDKSSDSHIQQHQGTFVRCVYLPLPNIVLNQLIEVVNHTGALGIPGLYVPADPGGVDENAKRGALTINFGRLFEKGLRLATGQCNVKRYNAYLRDMIGATGRCPRCL